MSVCFIKPEHCQLHDAAARPHEPGVGDVGAVSTHKDVGLLRGGDASEEIRQLDLQGRQEAGKASLTQEDRSALRLRRRWLAQGE
jgi:hypothetical protein